MLETTPLKDQSHPMTFNSGLYSNMIALTDKHVDEYRAAGGEDPRENSLRWTMAPDHDLLKLVTVSGVAVYGISRQRQGEALRAFVRDSGFPEGAVEIRSVRLDYSGGSFAFCDAD